MKNVFIILLLLSLKAATQAGDCILKPPAFTIHFGTGRVRDINTTLMANYERVGHYCPNDGHYAYTPYTSDCFNSNWHTLPEDHTPGDAEGNMMLINSSYRPGVFLSSAISGLKGNTVYELSLWLMNVCKISDQCPFPLLPNITILIETSAGKRIAALSTGEVPRREAPRWTMLRAMFTTPASAADLRLTMINNAPGGCGNDFALDDISFRECVKPPPVKVAIPKAVPKVTTEKKQTAAAKPAPKKAVPTQVKKPTELVPVAKQPVIVPVRDTPVFKKRLTVFPVPPPALSQRTNQLVKQIEAEPGEIKLDLYDNGEIDGDTVSIYHNNVLVVSRARLTQKPITLRVQVDASNPHHELVMVAENLGSIPPNTSVMIVTAGSKRYQVYISSTEQKNGKVVFDLKE